MPYTNNQGVHIYYEVEGEGPPLVLMYGIMCSADTWRQFGFVEPLRNDYQLILIDTRGHGASDKPHDPESYRLPLLVADVVAVLDDLDIGKAHYLGYSMGGFIGYGMAEYAPERVHSLIIGGARLPWKRDPEESKRALEYFKFREEEAFLAMIETVPEPWGTPEAKAILRANDLEALTAMLSTEEGIFQGFEDVAPTLNMPCLFYVGEVDDDPAIRQCVEGLPNGTYVSFPGLDHLDAHFRSDVVLPHVTNFLAGVS